MEKDKEALNSTLNELELTPFKVNSVPPHMKVTNGKRKLKEVNVAFSKRFAPTLNVNQTDLDLSASQDDFRSRRSAIHS